MFHTFAIPKRRREILALSPLGGQVILQPAYFQSQTHGENFCEFRQWNIPVW